MSAKAARTAIEQRTRTMAIYCDPRDVWTLRGQRSVRTRMRKHRRRRSRGRARGRAIEARRLMLEVDARREHTNSIALTERTETT